jgi:hypothetical protein
MVQQCRIYGYVGRWHDSALGGRAEQVRPALVVQTSTCPLSPRRQLSEADRTYRRVPNIDADDPFETCARRRYSTLRFTRRQNLNGDSLRPFKRLRSRWSGHEGKADPRR